MRKRFALIFSLFILSIGVLQAQQDTTPDRETQSETYALAVEPRQLARLRLGPGHTFLDINRLHWNDEIRIMARSRSGLWVYVHIPRGDAILDGWVMTGQLVFDEAVQFSEVPVNERVQDANTDNVASATLSQLYSVPILSDVSAAMQDVYDLGQGLGNHSEVITKIGDSLSASPIYLNMWHRDDHQLGVYDLLQPTVDYFGGSTREGSVAARVGLSSAAILDPLWADESCEPNETPLLCEYRLKKPSVVFVTFGPNDARADDRDGFRGRFAQIIEQTLALGIIPVLSTFSVHPDDVAWWPSLELNIILTELAEEYQVPLINLWSAARALPNYGLDRDNIHMKHSGYINLDYRYGQEAFYGISLQNLLALTMLQEIWTTLEFD